MSQRSSPSDFAQTTRSLAGDRSLASMVAMAIAPLLLLGWVVWLSAARIPVYVESSQARVEVDNVAHPLQAQVSGSISKLPMRLGMDVRRGEPLVELDTESERLELALERAKIEALTHELASARGQLGVEQEALAAQRSGVRPTVGESQAKLREAKAALEESRQQLELSRALFAEGLASKAEATRALGDFQQRTAAYEAARHAVGRITSTKRLDVNDRRVQSGALERQISALEGQVRTTEANSARLEHEVERRVFRAPIDGHVVEVMPITPGAMISQGQQLAVILPKGRLRVVAEIVPSEALGRIAVGQPARVRLEGFPWAQHGMVAATVSRVAGEVRDGQVRVELAITDPSRIPLRHGLPGVVEIEVERSSPVALVLRAAGRVLERQNPKSAGSPDQGRAL